MNKASQPRRVLRSLNLSLDVLELLSAEAKPLGLSEVSVRLGLSKAAVHAILGNLEARGYVERAPETLSYRLGHRVWELGVAAGEQIELRRIAHEHLVALTERTGESAQLAEYWSPGEVLYLDRVVSPNPVQAFVRLGGRAPAYCVATGRALLAHQSAAEIEVVCRGPLFAYTPHTITDPDRLRAELAAVRRNGVALNIGEYRGEIVGVAAPIRNHQGEVVAAVSVSGPAYRFDIDKAASFAPDVKRAADDISRKLGHAPRAAAAGEGGC